MGGTSSFYAGADYGLSQKYGELFNDAHTGYRFPTSVFGVPSDPRTANQVQAVSARLNTGAKTIEVSGITPQVLESIPNQHFKEINKLRKLAGVDLTFHGPLVEPTGVTKQGWDPSQREQAEKQMWSAVERAHELDPQGNLVITFHSSNGLPEPETKVYNPKSKEEEVTEIFVVDERDGQFSRMPTKPDYLTGKASAYDELKRQNEETWARTLQSVSFNAYSGAQIIEKALNPHKEIEGTEKADKEEAKKEILNLYKEYNQDFESAQKKISELGEYAPSIKESIQEITHGDLYIRDAYAGFKNLYNDAYDVAKRDADKGNKKAQEDLKKLQDFRDKIAPKIEEVKNDPSQVEKLGKEIIEGVNLLRTIDAPQTLKPLREFAIDKASETFSNLAFNSYKEFKDTAPIMSIENPPAGSGLNRAEDLKKLIEASREKFEKKAEEELGMSKTEAKEHAEKLIGATWDVGHINMIRKFGYDEKQLRKEAQTIAPFVKHIHLSDNFGLEHTELPMGMGNVPLKAHLEELKAQYGDKLNKIKQIAETGNWFEPFKTIPLKETLQASGSPIYGMMMAPYWNQAANSSGGYIVSRYGLNPDIHHSLYGAGFSGMPIELGGQMAGRNRLSGAPIE